MTKFCIRFLCWYCLCATFISLSAHAASTPKYSPAPVEKILEKQFSNEDNLQKYKQSIIRSYTLSPKQLENILETEYIAINRETERMKEIKKNWRSYSYSYRLINYKLNEQISDEIIQSRQKYIGRKKRFKDLIDSTQNHKPIYIIEATEPYFFYKTVRASSKNKIISPIRLTYSAHEIHYLSVFDDKYNHIFTYNRQHVNMLQDRRIIIKKITRNERVNNAFQKLFDDYLIDLKRIGAGLDINNPDMLTKISDMKNEYRSK